MRESTNHGHKLHNGAILSSVLSGTMPPKKDMKMAAERLNKTRKRTTKFLMANWKPVAIATASIAVVGLGMRALMRRAKSARARNL